MKKFHGASVRGGYCLLPNFPYNGKARRKMTKVDLRQIRVFISGGALLFVVLHLLWPNLKIDAVTISLLVLAAIPWITPFLKKLELPGGVKIELRDAKAATDKITGGVVELKGEIRGKSGADGKLAIEREDPLETLRHVAEYDPNLALVGFRIEIEKRLLKFAEQRNINPRRKTHTTIVKELLGKKALPVEVASGMLDLIALGNRAAHGIEVSPDATNWVLDKGFSILATLDSLIEQAGDDA
jgi:hypothetical protein